MATAQPTEVRELDEIPTVITLPERGLTMSCDTNGVPGRSNQLPRNGNGQIGVLLVPIGDNPGETTRGPKVYLRRATATSDRLVIPDLALGWWVPRGMTTYSELRLACDRRRPV